MTILNTIELTKTAPTINWVGAGWCAIGCLVLFLSAVACAALSDEVVVPTGKYQYEVLIDDEASFIEITEKYIVIEQRGEIFVVEEKE